jgi:GTPase
MANILAIVGRPNVGKSTLFNRLVGEREAIVDPTSGVTRDRHYGKSDWNGIEFSVIDTGGYVVGGDDVFEEEIRKQVQLAIEEADVLLFMVDVREGLTPMDEDVAEMLRKCPKKVFLAANKTDTSLLHNEIAEFYSLGLGDEIFCLSSISGSGTGDLLDKIVAEFENIPSEEETELPRISFVGKPNVGKSSMINALIGQERNIVTSVAGTTRDSIYTRYNLFNFDFMLVDTAGLRKKGKVSEDIEFYSTMRSIRSIENCDVCVLMMDATQGLESQDLNIFSLIQRNNKGVVIVVNKWDLVEKETNTILKLEELIRERIAPFKDVPIVFTSVLNKQRIFKVLEEVKRVYENRSRRISTSELNNQLLPFVKDNPPPIYKGKLVKVKYITQLATHYPSFVFFCNLPQYVKEPYKRFIENTLRKRYDFCGAPIKIYFREK